MIANVFALARQEAPCLLIFEDIDTIVTPRTRSYFFNEVCSSNLVILMVLMTAGRRRSKQRWNHDACLNELPRPVRVIAWIVHMLVD